MRRLSVATCYTVCMKTFLPAANPHDDSMEYRLLSAGWCMLDKKQQKLRLYCDRDDQTINASYSYRELDELYAGLSTAVVRLDKTYTDGMMFATALRATTAYVLDAYVDLRAAGDAENDYPYLCGIFGISKSTFPDVYDIHCLSFDVLKNTKNAVPAVILNRSERQSLSFECVENLWPGALKQIPIMESLGYDTQAIVAQLSASSSNWHSSIELPLTEFD